MIERMSPELERPPPPYLQIVEHYRALIRDGRLGDGERLPSTRELARQWQVAHATAAKVLGTLRAEGLVTARSGGAGGTLVRRAPDAVAAGHDVDHVTSGLRPVPLGTARIVDAGVVPAPPHVREALRLATDAAIRRRRVVAAGDVPLSVSTGWFPADLADLAPALLLAERIVGGTAGYVAARTGRALANGRDELRVRPADDELATGLAVDPGTPVLASRSWVYDTAGGVVEFGEGASVAPLAYDYTVA